MKRRNRKRGSKAAGPAETRREAGRPLSPSVAITEADGQTDPGDGFEATVEMEEPIDLSAELDAAGHETVLNDEFGAADRKPGDPGSAAARVDHGTHPGEEHGASIAAEKPAGDPTAPTGADRRTHPRYEFIAAVELVASESGARMETRVRDLSEQGAYVDTNNPLPLGTVTDVRIKKGAQLFKARARVVYSRASKGMGLVFTVVESEHHRTLETWLAESRETSWLAANRRRSQRVLMTIPVRVSGKTGAAMPFEEETYTRAISAHGALILMSTQVYRGQRLTLSNVQTRAALECVVAHVARRQGEPPQVGVEFALPNPMFWHVAFPPKDWTPRHPDAKSPIKTGKLS